MDPALALPSYRVYRGSLLALLAGTVFAVWLLVRPPATTDADGPVPAALAPVIAAANATLAPAATAEASITPEPTAAPPPAATPAPLPDGATVREHTVVDGDSMFSIAELYLPAGKDVLTFVEEIAAYNGLSDINAIAVGQVIEVPLE